MFLGEGSEEWAVDESRTVRLFMRMLVLRAVEMGKLELGAEEGSNGTSGSASKRRKSANGVKTVDTAKEDESDAERGVEVPSYREAMDALCDNLEQMPEALLETFSTIVKQSRFLLPSACRVSVQEGVELVRAGVRTRWRVGRLGGWVGGKCVWGGGWWVWVCRDEVRGEMPLLSGPSVPALSRPNPYSLLRATPETTP